MSLPAAQYTHDYQILDLTTEDFLELVTRAVKLLQWEMVLVHPAGCTALIPAEDGPSSDLFEVSLVYPWAFISSATQDPKTANPSRNRQQVSRFLQVLESLEADQDFQPAEPVTETPATSSEPSHTAASEITLWRTFRPRRNFLITPLIIFINLVVFIAMVASGADVLSPHSGILVDWGSNYQRLTLDGEPWRLLSSCFLHIGVVHLLANMTALLFIGAMLEPLTGRARFAISYLLSGIAGSLSSVAWHSFSVSAGASGAIFGMYGLFLVLLTSDLVERSARKALLVSMAIFVVYSLFAGVQGNTDNAAHIGGLIAGLLFGFAYIPSLRPPRKLLLKYATILLAAALLGTTMLLIYQRLPNTAAWYAARMQQFQTTESVALKAYKLSDTTSRAMQLKALKETGIANWERNLQLLKEFEGTDFPPVIEKRHQLLREYCELRIKAYNLRYRSLSQNSTAWDSQITEYNAEINDIIRALREEQADPEGNPKH